MSANLCTESVAIIGSGPAGLITAYTLLVDGFSDVQILTRDSTAGGVWATERVYPGIQINNVHGEYRFSGLEMPPPAVGGGRLTGQDLNAYMQAFSAKFLQHAIRFDTEVINIRRDEATSIWFITVEDNNTSVREILEFSRVVLCTGGCSTPQIPEALSLAAAQRAGFTGPVVHSKHFATHLAPILEAVPAFSPEKEPKTIVVIGGGKSAQDMAAYLAKMGRKVSVVFGRTDAFLASPRPLPEFIRKSRLLSIMSGHVVLRSRLERFLHTTWLGSKMTQFFWSFLTKFSLGALDVSPTSPLYNVRSLFWSTSVNDEGVPHGDKFHMLVHAGKIRTITPARVQGFGSDGASLVLSNGQNIKADLVLLATGYSSSWTDIFDDATAEHVGLKRHAPDPHCESEHQWDYRSLRNHPSVFPKSGQWSLSIYNGIVPAKNIARRDFAINGAVYTTNVGYTWEVVAHWVSSYFLSDNMSIPTTPEDACPYAERDAAWIRRRYPDALERINESRSSVVAFWTWPQYTDQLLEEMGLQSMRSGGNWLTWPFKVIELKELSTLAVERRVRRGKRGGRLIAAQLG